MANDETNEPERDVEAAAVRALDALTNALDAFTLGMKATTTAAEIFIEAGKQELVSRGGRS